MQKINRSLAIGLGIFAITTLLKHTIGIPEFLAGLGYAVAIVFESFGIVSMRKDLAKVRAAKLNFLKKSLGRAE